MGSACARPDGLAASFCFADCVRFASNEWEIDGRDGRRLEIGSDSATRATITYGDWSSRAEDRVFHDVALPFVLDPSVDGKPTGDGEFYVIAVTVEGASPGVVSARATTAAASSATSLPALPIRVGDHVWNGNGSLIAKSSGTATGYGLTVDEARVHPGADAPVVFFQWEVPTDAASASRGREVQPSATACGTTAAPT